MFATAHVMAAAPPRRAAALPAWVPFAPGLGKRPRRQRAPVFYQLLNNVITDNQTLVWQVETGSQADWNSAADLLKIN